MSQGRSKFKGTAETASGEILRFSKTGSSIQFTLPSGALVETLSTMQACISAVYKVESALVFIPNLVNASSNGHVDLVHSGTYVSRGITISSGGTNAEDDPQPAPPESPSKPSQKSSENEEKVKENGNENGQFQQYQNKVACTWFTVRVLC